jgi:branched-subunit amino acid transport protein
MMNDRLVGAIAAVFVGILSQNLLFTIVVGMAAFFG